VGRYARLIFNPAMELALDRKPGDELLFLEHPGSNRRGVQRVLNAGFTLREIRREAGALLWWLGTLRGGVAEA